MQWAHELTGISISSALIFNCGCFVFQDNEEQSYSTLKSKNTSARVSGLKPGTKYIFQVRARTSAGCGRFSQNVEIQTGKAGACMCVYRGLYLTEEQTGHTVSPNVLLRAAGTLQFNTGTEKVQEENSLLC